MKHNIRPGERIHTKINRATLKVRGYPSIVDRWISQWDISINQTQHRYVLSIQ